MDELTPLSPLLLYFAEMGGPRIPWRPGRSDREEEHCAPDGRLPDGDKGSDHLRHIFYRMG